VAHSTSQLSGCAQDRLRSTGHHIERLEHIVGWFDKWLMGMPKPEYEVTAQ